MRVLTNNEAADVAGGLGDAVRYENGKMVYDVAAQICPAQVYAAYNFAGLSYPSAGTAPEPGLGFVPTFGFWTAAAIAAYNWLF